MKKIILLLLLSISIFTACGKKENEKEKQTQTQIKEKTENLKEKQKEAIKVKLGVPKAPPALPVLRIIETKALGENVNIEMEIWDSPEKLIAMVQGKEHNLFAFRYGHDLWF